MTEDKKHQLDELSVTDILSYLGARASDIEEHIRRSKKLLTRFVMTNGKGEADLVKEAEQFLEDPNDLPNNSLIRDPSGEMLFGR